MKYSNAIIFVNGDRGNTSAVSKYIADSSLLIGCDGGANYMLEQGFVPQVIIGDFDSLELNNVDYQIPASTNYIQYPTDKDVTDSELALQYALDQGVEKIYVTNLLGTRLDHLIGNLFLIGNKKFNTCKIICVEGNQEVYAIENIAKINGKVGEIISFLPIFGSVKIVKSSGIKYKLEEYTLSMFGNQGVSNVITKSSVVIQFSFGKLLVVHNKKI